MSTRRAVLGDFEAKINKKTLGESRVRKKKLKDPEV
jgi:hypothetical protein